jgi:hypothetical protein
MAHHKLRFWALTFNSAIESITLYFDPIRRFARLLLKRPETEASVSGGVPHGALFILALLPRNRRESITGDLEEEFRSIYPTYGLRFARIWFWAQVIKLSATEVRWAFRTKMIKNLWKRIIGS